jgi:uncharacterized protein (DUF433 family)
VPADKSVIRSSPHVLGGTPLFAGTRVPVKGLFERLKEGGTVDDFLKDNPKVKREQVLAVLDIAWDDLLEDVGPSGLAPAPSDRPVPDLA